MSMEAVFKFYDRLSNDDALWSEFQAKHPKPSPEDERTFAAAHGYAFTLEELAKDKDDAEQQLEEEQLDQVAGGTLRLPRDQALYTQPQQIAPQPIAPAPDPFGSIASGDSCPANCKCEDVFRSRGGF